VALPWLLQEVHYSEEPRVPLHLQAQRRQVQGVREFHEPNHLGPLTTTPSKSAG